MRHLIDVLEKLDLDKVSLDEFPIDGPGYAIIEFLKANGFIINDKEHYLNSQIAIKYANMAGNKNVQAVMYNDGRYLIFFSDTSKKDISEKNPIYIIVADKNSNIKYCKAYIDTLSVSGEGAIEIELDKKKWFKEINKHFEF